MFKILKWNGNMKTNMGVDIYELEGLGLVAVDGNRSDGQRMEAWRCDESGRAVNSKEPSFFLKECMEPESFDEAGEPEDWNLVGFEEV